MCSAETVVGLQDDDRVALIARHNHIDSLQNFPVQAFQIVEISAHKFRVVFSCKIEFDLRDQATSFVKTLRGMRRENVRKSRKGSL